MADPALPGKPCEAGVCPALSKAAHLSRLLAGELGREHEGLNSKFFMFVVLPTEPLLWGWHGEVQLVALLMAAFFFF